MKILEIITVVIAAAIACAVAWTAKSDDQIVFSTLKSDGSTNTWTQAELEQALGLLNRKYHRDCERPSGREAWHGKLKKEIVDEENETKTEIYEDGTSFVHKFRVKTPSQAVAEANAKIMVSTNNVPQRVREARLRRMQEQSTTNIVNKVLTVGK